MNAASRPCDRFVSARLSHEETRVLSRAFHSMIPGTKYRIEMTRECFKSTFPPAVRN